MDRVTFKMNLLEGCSAEYKRRHDEIWPKLSALLKETGVLDYSIYLDAQSNTLFATLKIKDKILLDSLARQQIMRDWWKYMSDVTESNADGTPVLVTLTEMFHLE